MKAITLCATFDGEHIRLEDDFAIPREARLLVTVLPSDRETVRRDWRAFAAQSLAFACGENEPDYPDSCVQDPNPAYEGR
jgi:hypothetical protein